MRPNLSWRIPSGYGPFNRDNNFVVRALNELANSGNFRHLISRTLQGITSEHTGLVYLPGDIQTGDIG